MHMSFSNYQKHNLNFFKIIIECERQLIFSKASVNDINSIKKIYEKVDFDGNRCFEVVSPYYSLHVTLRYICIPKKEEPLLFFVTSPRIECIK